MDDIEKIVADALDTYGISVKGVNIDKSKSEVYEVEVDMEGELLIEGMKQGTLLYNKEREVHLKGMRDSYLLLIVS